MILSEDTPAKLDGSEAFLKVVTTCFTHAFRSGTKQGACVGAYTITITSPKQFIDWLTDSLTYNVPESDVDSGNHLHGCAAPAVIDRGHVHLVPETFNLEGIFSEEYRPEALKAWYGSFGRSVD